MSPFRGQVCGERSVERLCREIILSISRGSGPAPDCAEGPRAGRQPSGFTLSRFREDMKACSWGAQWERNRLVGIILVYF